MSDIRHSKRYVLDKVIKFKQFHSMTTTSGSSIYSSATGRAWIEKILPPAWTELCTNLGIKAGVVVLKSWEDESFYESASFGYGEEGFYYSFLARGESGWNRVKNQITPIQFTSRETELFCDPGFASVVAIRAGREREFVGFLLAEWEGEETQNLDSILYLFAEKITKERENGSPSETRDSGQIAEIGFEDKSPLVSQIVPSLSEKMDLFRQSKIMTIFGPQGSGKKTLAKWVHHQTASNKTCLFLSSIPEHLGKLEKALAAWALETTPGTMVFSEPKKWTLGQQKIVSDWVQSSEHHCQILFLQSIEEGLEILPGFDRFLKKNSIHIPGFTFLEKNKLEGIILSLFQDLAKEQNRNGMHLEPAALGSLLERDYPNHFTDLKNILLSGILKSKGNRIEEMALEGDISKLNLGVPDAEDLDLRSGIQALERQKILNAMRIFSGNQIRMAKALGISRGALQNKMKQLGIL